MSACWPQIMVHLGTIVILVNKKGLGGRAERLPFDSPFFSPSQDICKPVVSEVIFILS